MPADLYVEDVEIVARAMSALTWELASEVYRNTQRDQARVAVAALAEAGRLRDPDEPLVQWDRIAGFCARDGRIYRPEDISVITAADFAGWPAEEKP